MLCDSGILRPLLQSGLSSSKFFAVGLCVDEITTFSNVVSLAEASKKRLTLKDMVEADQELREFFKLIYEQDMREEAKRLIEKEIAAKRSSS